MSIYKGDKLVAGSGLTTGQGGGGGGDSVLTAEYIRNLHDPDWSKVTVVTRDQFIAGYVAPGRGIIVGFSEGGITIDVPDGNTTNHIGGYIAVKVNDVLLCNSVIFVERNQSLLPTIRCSVSKGDIFKAAQLRLKDDITDINDAYYEVNVGDTDYALDQIVGITNFRFVPYKEQ